MASGIGDLRCLLVSPLPPLDPDNGDAQYTRDLLADPPRGVTFVQYGEALETGAVDDGPSWRPGREGPRSVAEALAATQRAALNAARRAGWLLPQPVRWLRVRERFDVVHVHCMPVGFVGPRPPIVVTDTASTYWYWTSGRGMEPGTVERLLRRERRVATACGYVHPTASPDAGHSMHQFVPAGRVFLERAGVPDPVVGLCPAGVPLPLAPHGERDGRTILFVARNFALKGGPTVLDVFRSVRRSFPDARLVVAGCPDPDPGIEGVTWLGVVSRDRLYRDVYPQADLLLYPTTFDAAPLVVAEALANGMAVVGPADFGLPDMVVHGDTGFVYPPGDVAAATTAVLDLLGDRDRLRRMGQRAADDFAARMSPGVRNRVLLDAYRRAASPAGANGGGRRATTPATNGRHAAASRPHRYPRPGSRRGPAGRVASPPPRPPG